MTKIYYCSGVLIMVLRTSTESSKPACIFVQREVTASSEILLRTLPQPVPRILCRFWVVVFMPFDIT